MTQDKTEIKFTGELPSANLFLRFCVKEDKLNIHFTGYLTNFFYWYICYTDRCINQYYLGYRN
jgi:hypothetical protein